MDLMKLFGITDNRDYQICYKCGVPFNNGIQNCPNCHASMFSILRVGCAVVIALFAIVAIITAFLAYEYQEDIKSSDFSEFYREFTELAGYAKQQVNPAEDIEKNSQGIEIRINPMVELSGLNRETILKMRRDAIKNTIALGDVSKYEPNPGVLKVEDGLPWIGAYQASCVGTNNNDKIGEGESRESLGILNPELLYYFTIADFSFDDSSKCSPADYMIPHKLVYHKKKNTIVAYVNYTSLLNTRGYFASNLTRGDERRMPRSGYFSFDVHPSDANARDLGYNWAYADKIYNIKFASDNNFSKQVSPTVGYWHRGYACGLESGCNNYSGKNNAAEFRTSDLPAAINIKLWKKEPRSPGQKADINYMIVLE